MRIGYLGDVNEIYSYGKCAIDHLINFNFYLIYLKMRTVIIFLFFVSQGCRNKIDKISGFWREKDNSSSYEFFKNGNMVQHFVYEERDIYRINEEGEYQEPVVIDRECKYTIKGDSIFIDFPKIKLSAKLSQNWSAFVSESNFKGKIYYLMDNEIEFKGILNMNEQHSEVIYNWVKGDIDLKEYKSLGEKEWKGERKREMEYDRIQRTCDDQSSFDLGYDWAQDQLGKGLIADCNYLYEIASTQQNDINYLCFCKGVNYWVSKNQ